MGGGGGGHAPEVAAVVHRVAEVVAVEVAAVVARRRRWCGGRRSDITLKHDIVLLGHLDNGLGFYRFAYDGSSKPYVGVMAQEVRSGQAGCGRARFGRLPARLL